MQWINIYRSLGPTSLVAVMLATWPAEAKVCQHSDPSTCFECELEGGGDPRAPACQACYAKAEEVCRLPGCTAVSWPTPEGGTRVRSCGSVPGQSPGGKANDNSEPARAY